MKASQNTLAWILAVGSMVLTSPTSFAEEPGQVEVAKAVEAQKIKVLQTRAINNLRQIGLALFEFENEYGSFPNEQTAVAIKDATGTSAKLGTATANDCFFQLIAAQILQTDRVFIFEAAAMNEAAKPKIPDQLAKCAYSYLIGMSAAGNPSRPVVVAPLLKGKTSFDPAVFGGKAIVLRVDNSVQALPIGEDGHVMIDGKDIFDPAQPFWNGKVPPIRWPKD